MSFLDEFRPLPPIAAQQKVVARDFNIEVSLLIPARNAGEFLAHTVEVCRSFLAERFGTAFEIILIPNPGLQSPGAANYDNSIEVANALAAKYPELKVVPHFSPRGKGAALRSGFFAARGRWIFFIDSDLPYSLKFFDEAVEKLKEGYALVTGNRRLLASSFDIPVDLLPLAYKRHRMGLAFNRLVRLLMPIRTSDTQAGIKALSRELAEQAFRRQRCPGFFFDIEIFLTAKSQLFKQIDLPVELYLNNEKSTVRILRESLLSAFWLLRIAWEYRRGKYREPRVKRLKY